MDVFLSSFPKSQPWVLRLELEPPNAEISFYYFSEKCFLAFQRYLACDNFTLAIFASLLFNENNLTGKEYNSLDQGMHEKLVLLFIYPSK